jgi:hypothetical protein
MRGIAKTVICSLALCLTATGLAAAEEDGGDGTRTVRVDCSKGGSLNDALASKARVLVVEFTGTCAGAVTINRGDVTLRGADASATITVGPIRSQGYSRVTLDSFTLRDTPLGPPDPNVDSEIGVGIRIINTHELTLSHLTLLNIGNAGIEANACNGTLSDISIADSANVGISLAVSSAMLLRGTVQVTRSSIGVVVAETAELIVDKDANLIITDNRSTGVLVELKGHIAFRSNTKLVSDRNLIGIQVVDHGAFDYDHTQIEVANNRAIGVQVGQLSDWTVISGVLPDVKIMNNGGPGVFVLRDAFVRLRENTTITGNAGPGLVVDGSNVVVRNTTVTGNNGGQGDVVLTFGSGATFDGGNTFGTPLNCDGTVRARGQFQCSPTH